MVMTDLSNKRGEDLAMLYEKERRRLECQVERDMQTDPEINNVGCQTEFINPPMSLRTVIATTYNSAGERQRFPVVTGRALENPYSYAEEKLLQRQKQMVLDAKAADEMAKKKVIIIIFGDNNNNNNIW
jgi:hypothetical protein